MDNKKFNWMHGESLNTDGGIIKKTVEDAMEGVKKIIQYKQKQMIDTMEKMKKMDKMFKQMNGDK